LKETLLKRTVGREPSVSGAACGFTQTRHEPGSKVCTDEHASYRGLSPVYDPHHVKHSAREYVGWANDIRIGAAQSMRALLKRGLLRHLAQGQPQAPAPLRGRVHVPAQ